MWKHVTTHKLSEHQYNVDTTYTISTILWIFSWSIGNLWWWRWWWVTDDNFIFLYAIAFYKIYMSSISYSKGYRTLRPQDTSAPRHFDETHETLQHRLKTILHQKRGTRHFGIRLTKSRDTLDPGQFQQDTAPPVIWLKVGAEVSWCRSVLVPKCFVAKVSGSHSKIREKL